MQTIKFKTFIDNPVPKVYQSLLSGDGWNGCFTQGTVVDLEKKTIHFKWKNLGPDKVNAEAHSKIIDIEENKKIVFTWNEETFPKPTKVSLIFSAKGGGTILEVEDAGYPETKEGLHELMNCSTGWAEFLTLLKVYLETGYRYKNW